MAFDLMHNDSDTLRTASWELEEALRHYAGLYDIRNGASDTADEFHREIRTTRFCSSRVKDFGDVRMIHQG